MQNILDTFFEPKFANEIGTDDIKSKESKYMFSVSGTHANNFDSNIAYAQLMDIEN